VGSNASEDRIEEGWQAVLDDGRADPELLDAARAEPWRLLRRGHHRSERAASDRELGDGALPE
jgi:hypothetical protein